MDALLRNLAHLAETVDLESPGIGQYGAVPVHEIMQVTMQADDFCPGTQPEMECIPEDDTGSRLLQFLRRHGLDRAIGTNRHENRRLHDTATKCEAVSSGSPIGSQGFKFHACPEKSHRRLLTCL